MAIKKIQLRRDVPEKWSLNNPVLSTGEVGIELPSSGSAKIKIGDGEKNWNDLDYFTGVGDSLSEITYSELVNLRDSQSLVPGNWYRITDYITTTVQSNTKSAGNQFDLIVLALSGNELSHHARAIAHEGDTYFDGNDLAAWQIWYDLDNDTEKYDWADAENGKGVIYRMIDEKQNDCPYDFKNILFYNIKLTSSTTSDEYYYTFSYVVGSVLYDGTVEKRVTNCHGNSMGVYIKSNKMSLNKNVWRNTSLGTYCHDNTFGYNCNDNTFGYNCYNNTFGNNCYYNTFGNNYYSSTFGNSCGGNTLRNNCTHNTFGNSCHSNTFGNDCYSNTFGNNCYNNTFGNSCYSNIFGNNCDYNVFKSSCYSNTLGNSCYSNTFGENTLRRKIDSSSTSITFADEYYDDGNGELVPIKHPDLSTQPSILPYKIAGNYVYEQLICLSEANCTADPDFNDYIFCAIPWIAEVDSPKILSASFFTSNSPNHWQSNIPVMVYANNLIIEARINRLGLLVAGSLPQEDGTIPTGWLRIEYSEFKISNNYYYSYQGEEKLGELHIVYDTENYDNTLALALYDGQNNDGTPVHGDIISRCDADVPKGVRLHGKYLQKFLYEGLALALLADSTIYGLCKGTTCVNCGTGEPFVYDVSYPGPFANLYGLDIEYALRHGETVVLRISSTYS